MVDRFAGAFQELFDDGCWGRNIGIADAKIDQIDPAAQGFAFAAVDFSEEVRRQLVDSFGFFNALGTMLANPPLENRNGCTCFLHF